MLPQRNNILLRGGKYQDASAVQQHEIKPEKIKTIPAMVATQRGKLNRTQSAYAPRSNGQVNSASTTNVQGVPSQSTQFLCAADMGQLRLPLHYAAFGTPARWMESTSPPLAGLVPRRDRLFST